MSAQPVTPTPEKSSALPPVLASFIATRDKRIAKDRPWSPTAISDLFAELLKSGRVVVGGRATCGAHKDATWTEFTAWNEVVAKAQKLGFPIVVSPVKHGNGWATKAGGFWDENEYTLAARDAQP
jgi:hypothetical protein